jgi:K+-sensing histidine kinase KdpD
MNMLATDTANTLGSKNFMLMSLFSSNRPVGVVYTDVSNGEQPISDQEYKAFKTVCQSTSHALERYKLSR